MSKKSCLMFHSILLLLMHNMQLAIQQINIPFLINDARVLLVKFQFWNIWKPKWNSQWSKDETFFFQNTRWKTANRAMHFNIFFLIFQQAVEHLPLACEFITYWLESCLLCWSQTWRWTRGRLIALWRCEEKQRTIYLCLGNRTDPQRGKWAHWHSDLSQDAHYTQGQGAPCLYGPREHLVPACGFTWSPLGNHRPTS